MVILSRFMWISTPLPSGNTVIALTDGSSDGNIVWSWHIWVTNQDWNSKTVTLKDEEGHTYEIAPSVLGRCDNSPARPPAICGTCV